MNPYRKTTRTDKNHVNRYEKQIFGHPNNTDINHMIKFIHAIPYIRIFYFISKDCVMLTVP